MTGDNRPTCEVLNVGFLRGDSLLETRQPNDQFQHRVCEAVATYLRVDSPAPIWTFLGDGDECEDEERGAYLWSMEHKRLQLQYQGELFVQSTEEGAHNLNSQYTVYVILSLNDTAEVVVSEQIEVLKMSALTKPLVLVRLKHTAESKVRAFKELGSVACENNQKSGKV